MIKKPFMIGITAWLLASSFCVHSLSAENPIGSVKMSLVQQGIHVTDIRTDDHDLIVEITSDSIDGKATDEDIQAIRSIRNELRSEHGKMTAINNIHLKIVSSDNKTIYDGVDNGITHIPNSSSKINGSLDNNSVGNIISSHLQKQGMTIEEISVTPSSIGGKLANITLKAYVSDINGVVPQFEQWITALNQTKETGISQYNVTFHDDHNQKLFYLTADLVYQDFFWWQSDRLGDRLGDQVWTQSGPNREASPNHK